MSLGTLFVRTYVSNTFILYGRS